MHYCRQHCAPVRSLRSPNQQHEEHPYPAKTRLATATHAARGAALRAVPVLNNAASAARQSARDAHKFPASTRRHTQKNVLQPQRRAARGAALRATPRQADDVSADRRCARGARQNPQPTRLRSKKTHLCTAKPVARGAALRAAPACIDAASTARRFARSARQISNIDTPVPKNTSCDTATHAAWGAALRAAPMHTELLPRARISAMHSPKPPIKSRPRLKHLQHPRQPRCYQRGTPRCASKHRCCQLGAQTRT